MDEIHPVTKCLVGEQPCTKYREVANPNERSVHVCKSKGKWKLITRKPSKSDLKNREPITDIRRTYSQLLLSAISSCDSANIVDVFTQYCTADMTSLALYTGPTGNPRGTNIMEIRSLENHISFLSQYSRSVPDIVMKSEFLCAYTDRAAKMSVVKCKYRMSGTRVIDIKIENNAQKEVETKLQSQESRNAKPTVQPAPMVEPKKCEDSAATGSALFEKSELSMGDDDFSLFSFDCDATDGLLDGGWPLASASESSDSHATKDTARPALFAESAESDEPVQKKPRRATAKKAVKVGRNSATGNGNAPSSLYAVGQSVKIPDGSRIFLDSVPLSQSASLNYKGTFTVYLDENDKIFRYEFIYTVIDTI